MAFDVGVDVGAGQAGLGDEFEEAFLEFASGDLGVLVLERLERFLQGAVGVVEYGGIEDVQVCGAVADPLEAVGADERGQVFEGAGDGGDR